MCVFHPLCKRRRKEGAAEVLWPLELKVRQTLLPRRALLVGEHSENKIRKES